MSWQRSFASTTSVCLPLLPSPLMEEALPEPPPLPSTPSTPRVATPDPPSQLEGPDERFQTSRPSASTRRQTSRSFSPSPPHRHHGSGGGSSTSASSTPRGTYMMRHHHRSTSSSSSSSGEGWDTPPRSARHYKPTHRRGDR